MLFLIDYDRSRGQIMQLRTFAESERHQCEDARLELELCLNKKGAGDREVVVLESPDESTLRRTHRRYFADVAELATVPDDVNGNGDSNRDSRAHGRT